MDYYVLLFILILIIPGLAQLYVSLTYSKYRKIPNKKQLTGFDVARQLLDANGLQSVYIVKTGGQLSDHYDSSRKTVRLSNDVYDGDSMAALAIAAHEVGHALQDQSGYLFLRLRAGIFPIVTLGTKLAYIVLVVSFFLSMIELAWLAIIFMLGSLIFQIITLPVEYNASRRAEEEITKHKLTDESSMNGMKAVLKAAAMTYVAGVLASALEILRLALMIIDRRR